MNQKINSALATFAGGCFWGMQELIRSRSGVLRTSVGYSGGHTANPTYDTVKTGTTGHAESIQIEFDPAVIEYTELLRFFFRIHDPTTSNRQGNDVGTQYRSAIFFHSDSQRLAAEEVRQQVNASKKWPRPVVTEIVPFQAFYPAEAEHQDYLQHYPQGYTCHFIRPE